MSILKKIIRSLQNFVKRRRSTPRKKSSLRKKSSVRKKKIFFSSTKNLKLKLTPSRSKSFLSQKNSKPEAVKSKEFFVGEITHFFSRIQVVVVKIKSAEMAVGDRLHIKGSRTDFIQKVRSLQIESVDVKKARKGQLAGLKVDKKVKAGDKVFKIM